MPLRRDRNALVFGVVLATASSLTAVAVSHPDAFERSPMETLLEEVGTAGATAWDLPVTRNERVDQWIHFLSDGNASRTRLWLERSGRYEPMIRQQLRERGMPEDLVYLAFIESGFSPKAYSRAAASGMWQFIEETGKRYGLDVNPYVDERRDPLDATRAALDYLQALHDRFGSWYLAAAAYNTGEGRVERILKQHADGKTGSDDLFWQIAQFLPEETRNYVPLMLAAGHISKSPEKYGFGSIAYQPPIEFDTVWVPTQSSLELVAKAADVKRETVQDLNPHLVKGVTPPGRAYPVRIPRDTRYTFARNFAALIREQKQEEQARLVLAKIEEERPAKGKHHTIRRGETLTHIARQYDVSVASLVSANSGISARKLLPGKSLTIPGSRVARATSTTSRAAKAVPVKTSTKVIRLASTTTSRAASSKPAATSAKLAKTRTHSVRSGENLTTIAAQYDLTVKRLQSLNRLGSRSRIYPGQKLRIG